MAWGWREAKLLRRHVHTWDSALHRKRGISTRHAPGTWSLSLWPIESDNVSSQVLCIINTGTLMFV